MTPFEAVAETCATEAATRALGTPADFPPCWHPITPWLQVYDDILPDPDAYRALVLDRAFGDVTVGPAVFHGLAELGADDALSTWMAEHRPDLQPTLTFARRSPAGQVEPNYIHTDVDMGQWTGILYLNARPAVSDGTMFWEHRDTHAQVTQARTPAEAWAEGAAWRDASLWHSWGTVRAKYNRLVLFDARAFHSRAIADNYGAGADARLIQVMFGTFRENALCV